MAISLQGRLSLDVQFNGKSFPFGELQELVYLHMVESVYQTIPTLSLCVKDNNRWLAQNSLLNDGTLVTVSVSTGSETSQPQVFKFRKGAHKEERRVGEVVYTIDGWLDAPRYMNFAARKPIKGSSSSVLANIASDCGLTYRGDGTNDAQTWYPMGRPLQAFAQSIAKHGWASDTSCLCLSVCLDASLVYRDVTAMSTPVATLGLLDTSTPGVIPVTAFEPDAASASGNWQSGYGNLQVEQAAHSRDYNYTHHTHVGSQIEQGALQVSSSLVPDQSRITVSPIEVGNTHPSHARAAYQNRRVSQLFSVSAQAVLSTLTQLKCLDTVLIRTDALDSAEAKAMKAYAGLYRVSRRVIWVTPGYLVEKVQLVRRTLNLDKSDTVVPNRPVATSIPTSAPSAVAAQPSLAARIQDKLQPYKQKLSEAVAPVVAMGSSVVFSPGVLLLGITAGKDLALSAIQTATSLANNAANTLKSKMEGTDFDVRYTALNTEIESLLATALSAIAAHKLAFPGDPNGELPGIASTHKTAIQSAITLQEPDLAREANRAKLAVEAAKDVLESNPWSVVSKASSSGSKAVNALASASKGAGNALAVAAAAAVDSAKSASEASSTAVSKQVTATAEDLSNKVENWPALLETKKTAAWYDIDTAVLP